MYMQYSQRFLVSALVLFALFIPAVSHAATLTPYTFTKLLKVGSRGEAVLRLQETLNQDIATQVAASGYLSKGQEGYFFGKLTKAAIIKFQNKYASEILVPAGLTRANGQLGYYSRKKLNELRAAYVAGTQTSSTTITTEAPTSITSGSAVLKATYGASGSAPLLYFKYGTTLSTLTSVTTPVTGVATGGSITITANSLISATLYYAKACMQIGSQTPICDSNTVQFTTLGAIVYGGGGGGGGSGGGSGGGGNGVPTVTASSVSGLTATSVTLNGSVNPQGTNGTLQFVYAVTGQLGTLQIVCSQAVSGASTIQLTCPVTGLSPTTQYTYGLNYIHNGNNSPAISNSINFTTPQIIVGSVIATNVTNLGTTDATLNGTINPHGGSGTLQVVYGIPGQLGSIQIPCSQSVTGNTTIQISCPVTGLTPGTHYSFGLNYIDGNTNGPTSSNTVYFDTLSPTPTVIATNTTNLATTSVTLNGSINPQGTNGTIQVVYLLPGQLGSIQVPCSQSVSGSSTLPISCQVTGLNPVTQYTFGLNYIYNSNNSPAMSNSINFTTHALPTVTDTGASNVTSTTATLKGTVSPANSSGTIDFIYVKMGTFNYQVAPCNQSVSGNTTIPLTCAVTGLITGTHYGYTVKYTYDNGTILTSTGTQFTTL
jgi:hypothetical protein